LTRILESNFGETWFSGHAGKHAKLPVCPGLFLTHGCVTRQGVGILGTQQCLLDIPLPGSQGAICEQTAAGIAVIPSM